MLATPQREGASYFVILSNMDLGSSIKVGKTTLLKSAPGRSCDMIWDSTSGGNITVSITLGGILYLGCHAVATGLTIALIWLHHYLFVSSALRKHWRRGYMPVSSSPPAPSDRDSSAEPPASAGQYHTSKGGCPIGCGVSEWAITYDSATSAGAHEHGRGASASRARDKTAPAE